MLFRQSRSRDGLSVRETSGLKPSWTRGELSGWDRRHPCVLNLEGEAVAPNVSSNLAIKE